MKRKWRICEFCHHGPHRNEESSNMKKRGRRWGFLSLFPWGLGTSLEASQRKWDEIEVMCGEWEERAESIHSHTYGLTQPTLLTKSLLSTTPPSPSSSPLQPLKAYGVSIFFSLSLASTLPCFLLLWEQSSISLSSLSCMPLSPSSLAHIPISNHFYLLPPTLVKNIEDNIF